MPVDGPPRCTSKITAYFYPADHGFNCDQRGSWNAEAAKLARERTLAFFAKHVG
jgi:carboxymethylenebutenolidase